MVFFKRGREKKSNQIQLDRELCPFSNLGFHINSPLVSMNDVLCRREAQSHSIGFTCKIRIKYFSEIFRAYAASVIFNTNKTMLAIRSRAHLNKTRVIF